ncbi:Dna polymerase i protein [Thalictrum thalictroides]|uniref:Dna polymerase i protein n=1 Tax=Thalictrum thalictroides TaxID=46969 RepID=A0A7J6V971_THATH|nr:Dna polymerase i protein [Thalictrum thalictroides]
MAEVWIQSISFSVSLPWRPKTSIRSPPTCIIKSIASSSSSCCCVSFNQTVGGHVSLSSKKNNNDVITSTSKKIKEKRVFFLDVNPLCYNGTSPSLRSFYYWISLFFSQVSHTDPVIAVFDGEGGNQYRRELLPSYKAHRRKYLRESPSSPRYSRGSLHHAIANFLQKCNIPVVEIEGHEADDVVATLAEQALQSGLKVVIGSPDKDFKQLISEDVQIVMPMPELGRWSFYTLKHYIDQYTCDPSSDLSLRCILGDEVDGVPGIQHVAPGFGRKTAVKLLKKHGSLENLLSASKVRTVGKEYVQEALTKHGDYLRKNYEVLRLKKDVDVHLKDEWLNKRDTFNDVVALSDFAKLLGQPQKLKDKKHLVSLKSDSNLLQTKSSVHG